MKRLLLATALSAGSCAFFEPPPDLSRPPAPLSPASSAPIAVDMIVPRIARAAEVGRYIFHLNCGAPWGPVTWGEVRNRARDTEFIDQLFQELKAAGFTVAGERKALFAPERRPAFRVGAEVTALSMSLCRQTDWLFGYRAGVSGEAVMTVDWQLYSEQARDVVLRAQTIGRAERSTGTTDGVGLLIVDAFADAAAQLAREPRFASALAWAEAAPIETGPALPQVAMAPAHAAPLRVGDTVYAGDLRSGRNRGIIAAMRWNEERRRWIILADLPNAGGHSEALFNSAAVQIGVAAPDVVADPSLGLTAFLAVGAAGQP